METVVKNLVVSELKVLPSDVIVVKRFMGGMSNYVYQVSVNDELLIIRIPGESAELFVDRLEEYENIKTVETLNINSELVSFNIEYGYKISKYIEGEVLEDLEVKENLQEVAGLLKKLHTSSLEGYRDYKPFDRITNFEGYVKEKDFLHGDKYHELKNEILKYKDYLCDSKKVFCHNDAIPANIIKGDKFYLLDWEFAGNNDPMYDIASFGEFNLELALNLLEKYVDREPTNDEIKRVYLWSAFQSLQWYNVAIYKHLIGLSEKLNVRFDEVGEFFLEKCEEILNKLQG